MTTQPAQRPAASPGVSGSSDQASQALTVDPGAAGDGVVSRLHPLVQAVLDVTPRNRHGQVVTGFSYAHTDHDGTFAFEDWGPAEPIATRQVAAVLREHAGWLRDIERDLPGAIATYERADEIEKGQHDA